MKKENNRIMMTIPLGYGVGSHIISHSLYLSLQQEGADVALISPFISTISLESIEKSYEKGEFQSVLDRVCSLVEEAKTSHELIILEGVCLMQDHLITPHINEKIAKALAANVVFISCPTLYQSPGFAQQSRLSGLIYLEGSKARSLGVIVNKFGFPTNIAASVSDTKQQESVEVSDVLGVVPWDEDLFSFNIADLKKLIVLENCEPKTVTSFEFIVEESIDITKAHDHHLYIVSPVHHESLVKKLKKANKNPLVLVTDTPSSTSLSTPKALIDVMFAINTLITAPPLEINPDRIDIKSTKLAEFIQASKVLKNHIKGPFYEDTSSLTPTQFRYFLKTKAKQARKRIILPESSDDRILKAAHSIKDEGIAAIALVGDIEAINKRCNTLDLPSFSPEEVFEVAKEIPGLIEPLVDLRKHKGMDAQKAKKELASPIVLSTMLLKTGRVDGLVAGASMTTADTIRPAFQLIKTTTKGGQVSSLFFICFPEKVVIFADCAVNIDPTAEELAAIAVQTSKTAIQFGFKPKVAMLSYSTLESGSGASVDKVREAVTLVRAYDKDLVVDGPLQFDAAFDKSVAEKKAKDSLVAGEANIYIFPNLDAGNIAYKAATKASHVLAIGPVLQGLNQPVNDLSRGASVDDIVYTAAITAISS